MLYFLLIVGSFSGCLPDRGEEPIPAYLYIPSFSVLAENREGTSSSNITDVWLTVGEQFLGAYELPALIPVLETGSALVRLDAGIRDNGIHATPEIYPFYEPVTFQVALEPGKTDTLKPVTTYVESIRFALIEPFEQTNHLMRDVKIGDVGMLTLDQDEVFEGRSALKISLTEDQPLIELASLNRMQELGVKSPFVYLELNYKADIPVVFGLIGYSGIGSTQGSVLLNPGFYPSEEWQKIYFNFSSLADPSVFDEYQLVLRTALEGSERGEAGVWFDNFKLVFF